MKTITLLTVKTLLFLLIAFNASASHTVSDLVLFNSESDVFIRYLNNGDTIYTDENVNIRADVTGSPTESVRFYLNGTFFRNENEAPYFLAGDEPGNINEWFKIPGTYTLTAIPYTGNNGTGIAGVSKTVTFRVIEPQLTFTLVNAVTDTDIRSLQDGDVINLDALPTNQLNIRVNSTFPGTESVVFHYNGVYNYRVENEAPYALFGDVSGNYNAWTATPGTYTLTARAFTGNFATGTGSRPRTITYYFYDPTPRTTMLESYPNPLEDNLTLNLEEMENAEIVITDMNGKQYYSGSVTGGTSAHTIDLSNMNMEKGIYVVQVKTATHTKVAKVIKQ